MVPPGASRNALHRVFCRPDAAKEGPGHNLCSRVQREETAKRPAGKQAREGGRQRKSSGGDWPRWEYETQGEKSNQAQQQQQQDAATKLGAEISVMGIHRCAVVQRCTPLKEEEGDDSLWNTSDASDHHISPR